MASFAGTGSYPLRRIIKVYSESSELPATSLLMATLSQSEAQSSAAQPATYSDAPGELKSLLTGAGVYSLDGKSWVRITGNDRVRWLNGMVTNSIQQLQTGQGCYNFILSAQGRIQGDCQVFAQDDSLLLQTDHSQAPTLLALLDRFIIMDDVELHDESELWSGIGLAGLQAAAVLEHLNIHIPIAEAPIVQLTTLQLNGYGEARIIAAHSPSVPRFELWTAPHVAAQLRDQLIASGANPCGTQAIEWLRILEGTPRYGIDIRDKDLPQETAQAHALHFAKGCYIGQEIVERIRSRGNVHRTFTGLRLHGEPPAPGALLEADGQKAGEITSFARVPVNGEEILLALGYVRREALDRKAVLQYPGGTAEAVVLPYSRA